MQASDSTDPFQQAVLERLDRVTEAIGGLRQDVDGLKQDVEGLKQDVDGLKQDVDGLKQDVDGLKQELTLTNVRVDTYQKASVQVVNLAFGLLATATITVIVTAVVK